MATLEIIQQTIAPELKMLNDRIAESLASPNAMMNQIVENYLKTKGKQIRPILVLLSAKLFGEVNPNVISAAAAVEMLHNATLIHDDVVDETKLRRNHPTVNSIWDNHIAVLVGDFFVSMALQQAVNTGDLRIISSLSSLGRLLSLGEIDQIYNARYHHLDESAYFDVISSKTASLFISCIEMGGYAVGADEEQLARMCRFAELLGLCFQIKDDIFDYFEDKTIGKPTGNDLREGKITLPLLHVLLQEDLPYHDEMLQLSRKPSLETEDINRLIEYAKIHGGIEYAYEKMNTLRQQAAEIIATFPDNDATRAFLSIFDYIITRNK